MDDEFEFIRARLAKLKALTKKAENLSDDDEDLIIFNLQRSILACQDLTKDLLEQKNLPVTNDPVKNYYELGKWDLLKEPLREQLEKMTQFREIYVVHEHDAIDVEKLTSQLPDFIRSIEDFLEVVQTA